MPDAPTFTAEEVRRITTDAVEQALAAAAQRAAVCANRKPDLPPFDQKNIHTWIRRVEAAYIRASITSPVDKFAFLEGKISVDLNPKLNSFFDAPATADGWESFLTYLRKEYGRTKQQQAATLIDGVRRDGRRPSQLFSLITDLSKEATLDNVRKELLMGELPSDVRRALAEKMDDMTGEQAAEAADKYFDQSGKVLHPGSSSSVCHAR